MTLYAVFEEGLELSASFQPGEEMSADFGETTEIATEQYITIERGYKLNICYKGLAAVFMTKQ